MRYAVTGAAGQEATTSEAIALLESIAGSRLEVRRAPAVPALGWSPRTPLEAGLRVHWEWASARVAAR